MPFPSSSSDLAGTVTPERATLRVRDAAAGLIYHLVFEGDVRQLSGRQLRHHLARISHTPSTGQQLTVNGQPFSPTTLGGHIGLRDGDVVELTRHETVDDSLSELSGGARVDRDSRSVATRSTLRPSTDPETLRLGTPQSPRAVLATRSEVGEHGGRISDALPASPTSMRRAPSPERLVAQPVEVYRAAAAAASTAETGPCPSLLPVDASATDRNRLHPPLTHSLQRYCDASRNDSSLPLWTSATTSSSCFPGARMMDQGTGGPSVPPNAASSGNASAPDGGGKRWSPVTSSCARQQQRTMQEAPPAAMAARASHVDASHIAVDPLQRSTGVSRFSDLYQTSYEVPTPVLPRSLLNAALPTPHRGAAVEGLNYSLLGSSASPGAHTFRGGPSPSPLSPPPLSQDHEAAHMVATPAAAPETLFIQADELSALLEDQEYVWQMEAERFCTERNNRCAALQRRQRELALESAQYDRAIDEVERRLSDEHHNLTKLQKAVSYAAELPPFSLL